MRFMIRHSLLVLVLFCITSCGFHLRGAAPLSQPLQRLYIEASDPYGKLVRYLREYFKISGVQITALPIEASTILKITKEEEGQQLLSVGVTQETRQYHLTLTVEFQLLDSKGHVIASNQRLTETRALTIQSSQILAGSNEASGMYEQMRRAMVYDIISRLSSKDITDILTTAEKKTS